MPCCSDPDGWSDGRTHNIYNCYYYYYYYYYIKPLPFPPPHRHTAYAYPILAFYILVVVVESAACCDGLPDIATKETVEFTNFYWSPNKRC